jgi:uncharacterized membrane-anchored protein YhcB (DUF1043 family)
MKCEEAGSVMIDFLDNTLEKTKHAEVENHLETCEKCMDELKELQLLLRAVESSDQLQPDETLRINFYHMLHSEMNKMNVGKNKSVMLKAFSNKSTFLLRLAAGIALLMAGTFLGTFLHKAIIKENETMQVADLRTEVQSLKEMMMFSMLREESPSQRIKAVNITEEILVPDDKVLDVLIKTLNHDKNVNVRMAAAYSLAKFADRKIVRDSLVASLASQTEPILQVVLINMLVEQNESNAIKPMQQILRDNNTLKEVKEVAQKGIKVLL